MVTGGQCLQGLFGHRQHTAGATTAVVQGVTARLNLVFNRQKQQLGHELHHVTRREMLASLFIVFLVEAADQFLKHRAHAMVVERGQADAAIGIFDRQW